MIKSADRYSWVAKRLQMGAIIAGAMLLIFGTAKAFAHVEIHGELEVKRRLMEQERREKEKARQECRIVKDKNGKEVEMV